MAALARIAAGRKKNVPVHCTRKAVQQLVTVAACAAFILLGYAIWRGTAAAWKGILLVMAALANLLAVHLPGAEDEDH
jgi:hypothetical protein